MSSWKKQRYVSDDPAKRARQLANLRPQPAPPWKPGETPALKHGATRPSKTKPQTTPDWGPAVAGAAADLAARVGDELRGPDGELLPWAVPAIEAVALARVGAMRSERIVAAKGDAVTLEDLALAGKAAERYHRALDREGLTLRSRIDAARGAGDLIAEAAKRHGGAS